MKLPSRHALGADFHVELREECQTASTSRTKNLTIATDRSRYGLQLLPNSVDKQRMTGKKRDGSFELSLYKRYTPPLCRSTMREYGCGPVCAFTPRFLAPLQFDRY